MERLRELNTALVKPGVKLAGKLLDAPSEFLPSPSQPHQKACCADSPGSGFALEVSMEARAGRAGKQHDSSVRSGTRPVQQLQKNAQNISGTVLNIERKLHELDAGKVLALYKIMLKVC